MVLTNGCKKGQSCNDLLKRQRAFTRSRALLRTLVVLVWWPKQCAMPLVLGKWSNGQGYEEARQTFKASQHCLGLSFGLHPGGSAQKHVG